MENYKSLQAYNFFISGWVQTVYNIHTTPISQILKADVTPSYRTSETPHHPWVAVEKSGMVLAGHCDCMAGLGETCSHVAALLFKVEAANRLGVTKSACTDLPCIWNQCFTKKFEPSKICDIEFYGKKAKAACRKNKRALDISSSTEQEQILQALNSVNPKAVCLSAFSSYNKNCVTKVHIPTNERLPCDLRLMYEEGNSFIDSDQLKDICTNKFDSVILTDGEVKYVEESTRAQSLCQSWYNIRLGRITASVAHDFLHTNEEFPAQSLIKKVTMPSKPLKGIAALDYGRSHESDGYQLYSFLMNLKESKNLEVKPKGKIYSVNNGKHVNFKLQKCGLILNKEYPFLGASPDGLISCVCCGPGVLEIKCPLKYESIDLNILFGTKGFPIEKNFTIDKTHRYFSQIQLQILICNVNHGDLILWTPKDCVQVRVPRDNIFIKKMLEKLTIIWKSAILSELLTRRLENSVNINMVSREMRNDNNKTYCVCKTSTNLDEMVGCDKCNDWFHPKCIGLKKLPTAPIWYCFKCRKVKKRGE